MSKDIDDKAGVPDVAKLNPDLSDKTKNMTPKQRKEAALAMRLSGANYTKIADVLGFRSAAQVQSDIEEMLASTVTETDRTVGRQMATARLERTLVSISQTANDPKHPQQLRAAVVSLAFQDRIIKLNGYDAPTQHNHTVSASQAEIRAVLEKMAQNQIDQYPQEADILEGELADEPGRETA